MCIGHNRSCAGLKVNVIIIGQGQEIGLRLALRLIDGWAVIVRFYCHFISCVLARGGVRRGAADGSDSGGVQHEWAWKRGRSDLDPRLRTVFLLYPLTVIKHAVYMRCSSSVYTG